MGRPWRLSQVARTLGTTRRDPTTGRFLPAPPPGERFWSAVEKTETCWLWTAGATGDGYGAFYPDLRQVGAHVWSWEQEHGPVPPGRVVDHLCEVRLCVRPSHLILNTRGGNVLRSEQSNAGRNQRKTVCHRGHPLSGSNLIVRPNARNPGLPPWRACRTCLIEWKRARRDRARPLRSEDPER